ncbi:AN1-type zinc finger protein 5-like [Grus japonensis]|uniref:AN1-type zinc finger protein 5-like n=1 Tax=Grus japonensis TaxID=30415 RepID=A0ABC9WEF3_GRUJA
MPAGSKMDLLLAKAEPISILKKGRKKPQNLQHNSSWERGVRTCERNNSADTQVSEEGGGGGAPGTGAEIPLQPLEKTMVRQAVPLQPVDVDGGADIHLQPMEDPTLEQVDAPEGGCDPVGSPHWSRLLAGPVAPWREEPGLEQVCWQDL